MPQDNLHDTELLQTLNNVDATHSALSTVYKDVTNSVLLTPRSLLHLLVTSSPPKWAVDGVSSLQISSLPSAALSIHLPALSACGAAVFPSLPLVALVSRLTRVFRSCYYWSWCWYSESCGSCIDPRDFPSSASTYSWLLLPNVRIHRNLLRRYYDL